MFHVKPQFTVNNGARPVARLEKPISEVHSMHPDLPGSRRVRQAGNYYK